MKVLVTGATGFIGSHLVEKLVKEKYEVSVLIKKQKKIQKQRIDSINLLKKLNVKIYYGNLLDKNSLNNAVNDNEVIFHLAAIARPMAIKNEEYFKVNEIGTENLLGVCKNKKIKKIIIMSSISAVGPTRDGKPINEKAECIPVDTYGWSKLAQEKVALKYIKKDKLPITILRPPMVFGPRDYEMLKLFKAVNKRFFPIDGKEECLEFLYVENLVEACLLAIEKGKIGEIYHISNKKHYSINEIIDAIEKAENKKIFPVKFPNWSFMIVGFIVEFFGKIFNFHPPFKHDTTEWMTKKVWYSDISKAKKELNYNPKFSLEEGVKKTVEYYKEKNLL